MIKKFLKWFFRPTTRYGWGLILIVGIVIGTLLWNGLNWSMDRTNTLEFCISCHEMNDYAYAEYKESVHFTNASGVRAICSDCHVPKEFFPKLLRKIRATNELFHHLAGTIDTSEKYEQHRLAMAERVWESMEASDSHECRNCHSYESMNFHEQRRRSAEKMLEAIEKGEETCIDCHKGIAHKNPLADEEDVTNQQVWFISPAGKDRLR
ncbi:NapC/NirT family cytochrome c [Solemya velum gill symbiont]|uniref:NapC/NirT family cytochrome c n=1 Tax=Solemya velum gill symbiont TaxID=2340 RepID=UPI001179FF01|nr:NapC/NirT family cytochrome c [Solemya velum gill symbiont]